MKLSYYSNFSKKLFPFQKKHYFCEFGRVHKALTSIKKYKVRQLKNKHIENKKLDISLLLVARALAVTNPTTNPIQL